MRGFGLVACLLVAVVGLLFLLTRYGIGRAEADYPPLGRFVEVDGVRLHFVEAGQGTPIVFIHGASSTLRDFVTSVFPLLGERHRLLAFDRPGYGYSERPEAGGWLDPARQAALIGQALRALGVDQPVWVGHSWSGSLVLAYLLENPQQVAGGVLLGGASHPWVGGVAWVRRVAGVPWLGDLFARTAVYPLGKLLLEHAVAEVFSPEAVSPCYVERTGVVLALRPRSFLVDAEDVRELSEYLHRQSQRYVDIERPLLLITGDADRVVPPANHAERLIKQVPHAELVYLEDAGHAVHHTQSERVAALIGDFAERVNGMRQAHVSRSGSVTGGG
ncbi:MAG: alpha/beta fold hydrolase [Gammaproteobacteria bacterium]